MAQAHSPTIGHPSEANPASEAGGVQTLHTDYFTELSKLWRKIEPLLESGHAEEPQDRLYLPVKVDESLTVRHIPVSAALRNRVQPGTFYSSMAGMTVPFELEVEFNRALRIPFSDSDREAACRYFGLIEEVLDPGDCEGTEMLEHLDVEMDLKDLRDKLRYPLEASKVYLSNHRLLRRGGINQVTSGFHLKASTEDDMRIDFTQGNLKPLRAIFSMDREHPWAFGVENWPSPVSLSNKELQNLPSIVLRKIERTFRALRNK